jgi:hypothetical protein
LHFGLTVDFRGPSWGNPADRPALAPNSTVGWMKKRAGQESLRRRAEGRRQGTASTMTQSPIIASPMNSNTNASTAILPNENARVAGKPLTAC